MIRPEDLDVLLPGPTEPGDSWHWATVTQVSPLRVRLDGDSATLSITPDALTTVTLGHRVWCQLAGHQIVIHGAAGGTSTPAGIVDMFAGGTPPAGWLLCDGASLLRASYPGLFAAIGTNHGAVDSTHFNVPNLKGRVVVGVDAAQAEFNTLGETGGAKYHTLTLAETPAHNHLGTVQVSSNAASGTDWSTQAGASYGFKGVQIPSEGAGQPHNNMQPYMALNFIIKT